MMNSPTYIKNIQHDDVRGGGTQPIGRLHPNLVRREEGEVSRDAAGVAPLSRAVVDALFLAAGPPVHGSKGQEGEEPHSAGGSPISGFSPQLVLESVSGLDVGLAPPTWAPPAVQVPGVVGPTS